MSPLRRVVLALAATAVLTPATFVGWRIWWPSHPSPVDLPWPPLAIALDSPEGGRLLAAAAVAITDLAPMLEAHGRVAHVRHASDETVESFREAVAANLATPVTSCS